MAAAASKATCCCRSARADARSVVPGFEFFVDDHNYDEGGRVRAKLRQRRCFGPEPGAWRIELAPAEAHLSDRFLVVMLPARLSDSASHEVTRIEDAGRFGVEIKGPKRTTRWLFDRERGFADLSGHRVTERCRRRPWPWASLSAIFAAAGAAYVLDRRTDGADSAAAPAMSYAELTGSSFAPPVRRSAARARGARAASCRRSRTGRASGARPVAMRAAGSGSACPRGPRRWARTCSSTTPTPTTWHDRGDGARATEDSGRLPLGREPDQDPLEDRARRRRLALLRLHRRGGRGAGHRAAALGRRISGASTPTAISGSTSPRSRRGS